MKNPDYSDLDADIIDVTPGPSRRRGGLGNFKWVILAALLTFVALWRGIDVYTDSLWYDSLGFGSRFWYVFGLGWTLFGVFAVLTLAILRGSLYLLERWFRVDALVPRRIIVNKQPVDFNPAKLLRPIGWILSIIFAIVYGLELSSDWQAWVLYFHQPVTLTADPIFGKSVGFYLFSLPIYEIVAGWLTSIAIILFVASVVYAIAAIVPAPTATGEKIEFSGFSKKAYAVVSAVVGILFLVVAVRTMLSRYAYLWTDHSSFSGITYAEANYLLPGLTIAAISLAAAAIILFVNALTRKGGRLLIAAFALPIVVYFIGCVIVPAYVQSFVVKPNELDRETPFIEHNIAGTRAGFNIENVKVHDYAADTTPAAFNLAQNRSILSNIRLWDWNALQDTLRQIQEIRTYYDFPDVDVDRYRIGGEMRQVMIATREMDVNKLPEQSRNWINERLVYTHGYGLTMNPVNEFTAEGKPRFILSNVPVESTADISVTRTEIDFGERTDTIVYVDTKQREFDYRQGENNNYTNYEGTGGFAVGTGLRRMCIAWATDDMTKLPFSDDVTAESRVLMHRNIKDRITRIAPFFSYDTDPYMVVNDDGLLVWMIDGYATSDTYPYSRHYDATGQKVNYIRNSVKVTIDAYTGDVNYYVFDESDPITAAYRAAFPALFKSAAEMPPGLRKHIRYPELLIKTQGDVFGLYHTQNAKMFFGREDVW